MSELNAPRFNKEPAARRYLERVRWPDGPVCPHCGGMERAHRIKGKGARRGLWFCGHCRKQFTVTVGTVFERSKIPLHKWLLATHLLCASKKGMSSHQLHRMLGVTYKTAWFMTHRIREAMRDLTPSPMGGKAKIVESDETYFGPRGYDFTTGYGWQPKAGAGDKYKIMSLVERGGRARSFHIPDMTSRTIRQNLVANVMRESTLMTDEAGHYKMVGREYRKHRRVHHTKGEYVRGSAHTNTVESFFSLFKRGMRGTYQHCGEKHLQRYLHEFDFRHSYRHVDDPTRALAALKGIEGKRLTYRRPHNWY